MSAPYILHYSPSTASMAVHWMLIHLGAPFELEKVDIDGGAQNSAAYRKLNPAGRVPTLIVDGKAYGESAALLMLLAERHPEAGLAPAPGSPDRPAWMSGMIYLANVLLPAFRDWFYAEKDGAGAGADSVKALARVRIEGVWDRMDRELADGRAYFLGDRLSTIDFLATTLMRWSRKMPKPATDWPNISRYVQRMRALLSFIALCDAEGLTEWRNP
ncbi:MAG TPA: glutathione S-transferase family protein [Hyphomonadaceae bacterium]|nr:glutathione S-transferase family protein [Hyphomonadaceae bacterium]